MPNSKIKSIKAREILDSKGNPTVEAEIITDLGKFSASVPSGVSKEKYEAVELRDGGKRYQGKGVLGAVKNVNEIIAPKLKGEDPREQKKIDKMMAQLDGTQNKSKLGSNAILAVSLAVCRAGARANNIPLWEWISRMAQTKPLLPSPCILYLEGGLHGQGDLDIQELMAVFEAETFSEKLRLGTEIYHRLGEILIKKYGEDSQNVGLEGAFTPAIKKTEEALELIMEAAQKMGAKDKIKIILDIAASVFSRQGKYYFEKGIFNQDELLDFYSKILQNYPIIAIEDPFAEEDWLGFQKITKKFGRQGLPAGRQVTIIGDDFLATNIKRIKEAAGKQACNGLILKPNQIGTVSETLEAAKYTIRQGWKVFVKHRGGETNDDFIADLAAGLGTGWIMAGAPSRGERVAKYNRLLQIEEELK